MTIWVDADACPNMIKTVLFRAAERTGIALILVANQPLSAPPHPNIRTMVVNSGFDEADNEIVRRVEAGDLVVTADIPLAAELLDKGAEVISPRGEVYTAGTIRSRLNMRDFMETLRSSGIQSGGPASLSETDKRTFANALDRYLAHSPRAR
ncbi:MAG: YaiI/YqxD family protein [Pseudohongiellaceae bacterium]